MGDTGDFLGYDVTLAPDLSGDGQSDVVAVGTASEAGFLEARVFAGPIEGRVHRDESVASVSSRWWSGRGALALPAGDVNGDAQPDQYNLQDGHSGVAAGEVSVYTLLEPGSYEPEEAWFRVQGSGGYTYLGERVGMPGDLDGDGFPELVASVGYWGPLALYVHEGPLTEGMAEPVTRDHLALDDRSGEASPWSNLEFAGGSDLDGDGRADLVVTAREEDADSASAFLFYEMPRAAASCGSCRGDALSVSGDFAPKWANRDLVVGSMT